MLVLVLLTKRYSLTSGKSLVSSERSALLYRSKAGTGEDRYD